MNGFERRKEKHRQAIRRAALDLFRTFGFKRVTVSDVARRAGVAQVTIYNHFGSKDELVQQVVQAQLEEMLSRYSEIVHADRPFPEKMEAIVLDKAKVASQFGGELLRTVYREYPHLGQLVESLWRDRAQQLLTDMVADGKTQGYIDPGLSDEVVRAYLEIVRRGVAASADSLAEMEWSEEFVRQLNLLFLYGLVGQGDTQA